MKYTYWPAYFLVIALIIALPSSVLAGCPTDMYPGQLENVTCTGSVCDHVVVLDNDWDPTETYYETNNCGACYTFGPYGETTKCTEHPECNLVIISHQPACGLGYQIPIRGEINGESVQTDQDSDHYSKEEIQNNNHIIKQLGDTTLEFDLVGTDQPSLPTTAESSNTMSDEEYYARYPENRYLDQEPMLFGLLVLFSVITALMILIVWFFKRKSKRSR